MRSLKLTKECLTELTAGDLADVIGGIASGASCAPACPQSDFQACLTSRCLTNTLLCP